MEDLKDIGILHRNFLRTLPFKRRGDAKQLNVQYNNIRGDQWSKDDKIVNFDSFPVEIKVVLDTYINIFDTKLWKSMNVEPMQLNVREGTKPYTCFTCRPTPAHYRETGRKLVQDLLDQDIIKRCRDSRSEWCAPAHFVEKAVRVPLTLRLVLDFTQLNERLIRDQLQVFPTGEEIRQQLGVDCKVWVCMDALAAYFQIKVARRTTKNHIYAAFRSKWEAGSVLLVTSLMAPPNTQTQRRWRG